MYHILHSQYGIWTILPVNGHCVQAKLYYTILYYTILYYTILYYTILYYTILYYTILYYVIRCYTILYYTSLDYTILYRAEPRRLELLNEGVRWATAAQSCPIRLPASHRFGSDMAYTGGCQNHGPLLGPLNTRCRIILRTQKGTIILTTTHTTLVRHDTGGRSPGPIAIYYTMLYCTILCCIVFYFAVYCTILYL